MAKEQNKGGRNFARNKMYVCTLSGTSEIGRNCTFVQYNDNILVVDMGFAFPNNTLYGIDYMIPNLSYLKKNKSKIKGILITHGHLDHTGALPYAIEDLGFPTVYAGDFTNDLIKNRLKEFNLDKKTKFFNVSRETPFNIGPFKVRFIRVTHAIPDSRLIFIEPPNGQGKLFFSGDYKIDTEPVLEAQTSYSELEKIQGSVDLAFMESTYPDAEGHSISETEVAKNLEKAVRDWDGRIIISSFSNNISRLFSMVNVAKKTGRKVAVSGRSLKNALDLAFEKGFIKRDQKLFVREQNLSSLPDNKVLFITTGSQGERYAALNRISLGEHPFFKLKEGDLVILSNSEIPGNIFEIESMTDRLIEKGADILKSDMEDIHSSGHGLNEDRKKLLELVKPRSVMPYHGNLTKRYRIKQNYIKWGVPEEKIYLTSDGQFWEHQNGANWKRHTQIPSRPILIDGLGTGEIGDVVLKDRQQLAEYGIITAIINLSNNTKKIWGKIQFISRGFVYAKNAGKLYSELEQVVRETHKRWWGENFKNKQNKKLSKDEEAALEIELRGRIIDNLEKRINKRTEREPVILVIIT